MAPTPLPGTDNVGVDAQYESVDDVLTFSAGGGVSVVAYSDGSNSLA